MTKLLSLLPMVFLCLYAQEDMEIYQGTVEPNTTEFVRFTTQQNQFTTRAAEDACASAVTLGLGNDCHNSSTNGHSVEAGENFGCVGGISGGTSPETSWYRFNTGTNTEINFSFMSLNTSSLLPAIVIWGPYAPGTGCMPSGTPFFCENIFPQLDPGQHRELTGLTPGMDYLIQVIGRNAGGSGDRFKDYCIGVYEVPANNAPGASSIIDQCGITFDGTNAGYSMSTTTAGDSDLDGNDATQCPTVLGGQCNDLGEDVPYVINNDSWFSFCAIEAADYQIDLSGITNCALNQGVQMSVFTGTQSALTYVESAPSPAAPGTSWTSSTVSLAAGECVYLMVDGFAGDMCDYSYVLTNLTGTCELILPMELIKFQVANYGTQHEIIWDVAMDTRGLTYHVEYALDGANYQSLNKTEAMGYVQQAQYHFTNKKGTQQDLYYRLVAEEDGKRSVLAYTFVKAKQNPEIKVYTKLETGIYIENLMPNDEVRVFNTIGQLLYTKNIKEDITLDIPFQNSAAQFYIVQVQRNGSTQSFKVIQ